jgi:hypothetical protein
MSLGYCITRDHYSNRLAKLAALWIHREERIPAELWYEEDIMGRLRTGMQLSGKDSEAGGNRRGQSRRREGW